MQRNPAARGSLGHDLGLQAEGVLQSAWQPAWPWCWEGVMFPAGIAWPCEVLFLSMVRSSKGSQGCV